MSAKPQPKIDKLNAEFWEGTAVGELRVRHCRNCDALFRFTHPRCPCCWCRQFDSKISSGRGKVVTYTVVHVPPYPAFEDDVPYVLALVELEEGVRMMCNIVNCNPLKVHIEMSVSVIFEDRNGVAIPQFQPVS